MCGKASRIWRSAERSVCNWPMYSCRRLSRLADENRIKLSPGGENFGGSRRRFRILLLLPQLPAEIELTLIDRMQPAPQVLAAHGPLHPGAGSDRSAFYDRWLCCHREVHRVGYEAELVRLVVQLFGSLRIALRGDRHLRIQLNV